MACVRRRGRAFMCESVPRVVAPPRRLPRARLLRGAPPPHARRLFPRARRVAPVTPPGVIVPLPHRGRRQPYGNQIDVQATRGGRRARWGQRTWPRCGVATRAGRRWGAQPHIECAPPIGHLPARGQ
jgi:hypothetical protein